MYLRMVVICSSHNVIAKDTSIAVRMSNCQLKFMCDRHACIF